MPKRHLVIEFEMRGQVKDEQELIHKVRNFGEDLYVAFRKSELAKIDLTQIDAAVNRLVVSNIGRRDFHSVRKTIEQKLVKHYLDGSARLVADGD